MVLENEIFKYYLPYMDTANFLFNSEELFEQQRKPSVKSGGNWSSSLREEDV